LEKVHKRSKGSSHSKYRESRDFFGKTRAWALPVRENRESLNYHNASLSLPVSAGDGIPDAAICEATAQATIARDTADDKLFGVLSSFLAAFPDVIRLATLPSLSLRFYRKPGLAREESRITVSGIGHPETVFLALLIKLINAAK